MRNLLLQSRVVTDPLKGKLVGWWKEYYIFYVKLRDLPSSTASAVETMLLDPSQDLTAVDSTTDDAIHYFTPGAGDAVNWSLNCLQRVTEEYFRDEDETWNTVTNTDGVPMAKINQKNWADSLFASSELPTDDLDYTSVSDEPFEDFQTRWQTWILLRQQQMTDLTWEDYLATFGVKVRGAGKSRPELLRFMREWSYPSNTVATDASGSVSSAVSWSIAERADKNRLFEEPGFIFGVTVTRPKTYNNWQKQSASVMLDNAKAWMPALLAGDPSFSIRRFASDAANGPLSSSFAEEYTLDVRDLYLYGDQWYSRTDTTTIASAGGEFHIANLNDDTHYGSQYLSETSIDSMWSDQTPGDQQVIREDGVVQLDILGTQVDHT
jgi:hypothetical protein